MAQLKMQGYKTIINLDDDSQVEAAEKLYAEKLGFKFYSYPLNPWQKPDEQKMNTILNLMSDKNNYPLFIHCKHGRDRTGNSARRY